MPPSKPNSVSKDSLKEFSSKPMSVKSPKSVSIRRQLASQRYRSKDPTPSGENTPNAVAGASKAPKLTRTQLRNSWLDEERPDRQPTHSSSDLSKAKAGSVSSKSPNTIDIDDVATTKMPTRTRLREQWLHNVGGKSLSPRKSPGPSIRVGGLLNTPTKIVYHEFQGKAAPILHVLAAAKHKYGHEDFELSSNEIASETFTSVLTKHHNKTATMFSLLYSSRLWRETRC